MNIKKNVIFKNALILLITSLIIRLLSLVNRIYLVRTIGSRGISIYNLILPTIMLFMSIGCFSLNTAMVKLSATTKSKSCLKKGIILSLIASTISSIILLIIAKVLSYELLKQPLGYSGIIISIPLIFLTSISAVLRGYYTGIQKMEITSFANLIEQFSRILFTIIVFYFANTSDIVKMVNIAIFAMSIGEMLSISFTLSKLKKYKPTEDIIVKYKDILAVSVPTTCSSLVSNITFFLEPILYTFILGFLNYKNEEILYSYTEITAYALPLITLFSFISMTIATVIMPSVASSSKSAIKHYIEKTLVFSILPSIPISILLYFYSFEYSSLLYNTTIGADIVKKYVFLFAVFYFIAPLISIMQATSLSKPLFIIQTICHILKLILIIILPFFTSESLILSYLIIYYLLFLIIFIKLKKEYQFSIKNKTIFSLLLVFAILFLSNYLLTLFSINYLINTILTINLFFIIIFITTRRHNK